MQLDKIEKTIGYAFRNGDLLRQAFVRKSYSAEHGGQDNEVLEFIGDKVLDLVVIRIMMARFGAITENKDNPKYFCTKYDEGKLTDIKKAVVEGKALSSAMDALGFQQYLVMGQGDIKQNVQNEASVKEDLFEAVLGAVALDSDWDLDALTRVAEHMFDFDAYFESDIVNRTFAAVQEKIQDAVGEPSETEPIRQLNELYQKKLIRKPVYTFRQGKDDEGNIVWRCECLVEENGRSFYHYASAKKDAQRASAYEALRALLRFIEEE